MTLNNYNRFVDNILFDDGARKYIKGIAYQWAGQNCIARTHESWPEIELIQSESECGTGDNSWEYAEYIFPCSTTTSATAPPHTPTGT